jgi:hypothetical protein
MWSIKDLTHRCVLGRSVTDADRTAIHAKEIALQERAYQDEKNAHLRALRLERDRLSRNRHVWLAIKARRFRIWMLPRLAWRISRKWRARAIGLAASKSLVAIATQQPFRKGDTTTGLDRRDRSPCPAASPGSPCGFCRHGTNVVECFQTVWRMAAQRELLRKLSLAGPTRS